MVEKFEVGVFGFKVAKCLQSLEVFCSHLKLSNCCCKISFNDSTDSDAALNTVHVVVFSNMDFLSDSKRYLFQFLFTHCQQLCFDKQSL